MNDAAAALRGEISYGIGKGMENAVIMILGTGIGTAVCLNGRYPQGSHGAFGMLGGHIAIDMDGKPCTCPNQGCLEAYAGSWALPSIARKIKGFDHSGLAKEKVLNYQALAIWYKQQDVVVVELFKRITLALSIGAVNLIHAYDPDCLIISGGPSHFKALFPPIKRYIETHTWAPWGKPSLLISEHPEESTLLGLHAYLREKINNV